MFDFINPAVSSPGRRERLRSWASSRLFIAGHRLSPDEAVRFAAAVREQTTPQPATSDLIAAFLSGGIPAVLNQLS
ncbi:MAG: hypothetical protein ACI8RZ_001470 [Myxococcota bacterium]|jgi:hypothetical protein